MSNKIEYGDLYAFHPGYYIADVIADMGISQAEFAMRMGTTGKTLSQLVNGRCNLTNDLARKLSAMFGTGADIWLNLQKEFDEKRIAIEERKAIDAQRNIVRMIDYKYFVDVAGLPPTRSMIEKIKYLCAYLKIADLHVLAEEDILVNYRSGVQDVSLKHKVNSRAWVQVALNRASHIRTESFSAAKLKASLPTIRDMTVHESDVFLPVLAEIFADCGVAFVLLPHLKNSGVNGAVKWLGHDRVVLALNNRRCYADTFWFALFHEIKHVLQQKLKTIFVSGSEDIDIANQDLEIEADAFARNYLIPADAYREWNPASSVTASQVKKFAEYIGIHPGIVVGRLQHDGIILQNQLNGLKTQYKDIAV